MPDMERVVWGLKLCTLQTELQVCSTHKSACGLCTYKRDGRCNFTQLMKDALELLEEREPVAPYWFEGIWKCGQCGDGVVGYGTDHYGKFCPVCGRRVKWNEVGVEL